MIRLLVVVVLCAGALAHADDERVLGLTNESELGYVVTGGNSESETSTLKQTSTYNWEKDSLIFKGHYLQASGTVNVTPTQTQSQDTAENWAAKLRYEHVLVPKWFDAFIAHGWYGDRFQGIREGYVTDLGLKYYTANSKEYTQFFEVGYTHRRELYQTAPTDPVGVGDASHPEFHSARLYGEVKYQHNKSLVLGAWVEYLPSIVDFSNDQRLNYSPYLTSVLTDMFSLKISYEGRYRYKPAQPGNKLTDYTFTTALLAKF